MISFLRYQLFAIYGITFLALWISLKSTSIDSILIHYAPLFLIAVLGVYALCSITIGVINLKDCPDAALEVERDVKEAKAAMVKKGII
jgi:hypothetical protein